MTEHVARYLVGGPGWPGAGPAAVDTDVLTLSVDAGAKVTRGSRTLVTAGKGNGPPRVRSFAGVGAGPVVHPLTLTHAARGGRRDGYRGHRRLHRYPASVCASTGPRAGEGRKVLDKALHNDEECLRALYEKLATGACWWWSTISSPSGPWQCGGSGHGHHRGLTEF